MRALILALFLVSCSDSYRYPCQDPDNQATEACNPPACVADGTCTEYLVKERK